MGCTNNKTNHDRVCAVINHSTTSGVHELLVTHFLLTTTSSSRSTLREISIPLALEGDEGAYVLVPLSCEPPILGNQEQGERYCSALYWSLRIKLQVVRGGKADSALVVTSDTSYYFH